jgi:acyl-CoA synthetase (AMP-forming)/AMP-acid ligase II
VLDGLEKHCGELVTLGIFGQTEAIACHRFWPSKWPEVHRRTAPAVNYVGVPSPLLASDVVDETGAPVRGEPGEAVYRSPIMTAGYYRNPEATAEAFRGGWFHSGDSATVDGDGLRIMVDRYKDIVKTGGENVSSMRVEAVLTGHPDVLRAAVVGLPHERWGEAVTAVVVPQPGAEPDADAIVAYCRERLAGFETPKRVVVADALPETVGGKVLKYKLRAAHAELYTGS